MIHAGAVFCVHTGFCTEKDVYESARKLFWICLKWTPHVRATDIKTQLDLSITSRISLPQKIPWLKPSPRKQNQNTNMFADEWRLFFQRWKGSLSEFALRAALDELCIASSGKTQEVDESDTVPIQEELCLYLLKLWSSLLASYKMNIMQVSRWYPKVLMWLLLEGLQEMLNDHGPYFVSLAPVVIKVFT